MPLNQGDRVGIYEIVAPIGAGGMGEVYRANDSRLNRHVAVKVLPAGLESHPERATRFKREAQVLASLNHPNIAAIYGWEEIVSATDPQPTRALVMELVEGPTLADRLAQGPMPLDEVMATGKQITEAIEYAHEQGVIHRDLKPANIKLTSSGAVKVLDFGLAKALDQGSGTTLQASGATDAAGSPTLSLAATQAGLILGTAAYMSPEQAKGKAVDRRADIWSFGIVLFEMLTGRAAYSGETVSETMAHVITKEPDWSALPATTPPRVRELLRRCLVKDPRNRLQAIGEARIALQQANDPEPAAVSAAATRVTPSRSNRREWIWAALAIVSLLAATALAIRDRLAFVPPLEMMRFELATPARGGPAYPQGAASISPDGRRIAYVALSESRPLLWVHTFETGTAQAIESTAGIGPSILIWSPDSRHLAFSAEGRLKRVEATGGPAQVICTLPESAIAASWGADNVILIGGRSGIQRAVATGGDIVPVGAAADEMHRFPSFLPDGRHYFYLATRATDAGLVAYVGTIDSADRRPLEGIASEIRYAPSGHALFLRDGALMAQRFDVNRLELKDVPFLVIDQFTAPGAVAGPFSISATGTLAYRSAFVRPDSRLVWLDRSGRQLGVASPPGRYADIDLSPDDRFVVFEAAPAISSPSTATGGFGGDIWALDIATGVTSRVTSDPAREADPVWSADGKTIAFRSDRDGGHLYGRPFGGLGDDAVIFKGKTRESPDHYSPDGAYLVYTAEGEGDVWALPMTGDRQPIPVATTKFREADGRVAPNSRWIAYVSNESGRYEVYVQSFPKATIRRQVSTNGGSIPRWSHDGSELYFVAPAPASKELVTSPPLMVVAVRTTGESLSLGAPTVLFHAKGAAFGEGEYAVSSTGRFLVNMPMAEAPLPPITVILNWATGLRR